MSHEEEVRTPLFHLLKENPLETMECFPICQPVLNPDGICPGSCFGKCPDLCRVLLVDDAHLYPYVPPPPPPPQPINRQHVISTSMSIGASLLGTVLFLGVFCIVSRSYCRRQGNRRRGAGIGPRREDFWGEDNGFELDHPIWYIHTVGLEQSMIDSITVFKYKKGEGGLVEGGTECSVCLSEFRDDESLRLLPKCSHAFHLPCIDTWLRSHKNCPVCRAPIVNGNFDGQVEMFVPLSGNLSSREEAQMGNSVSGSTSDGEVRIVDGNISASEDETNGGSKLNLHDSNSSDHIQVPSDLVEHGVEVEAAIQTVRRSVSLDSSSALAVYAAVSQAVRDKQQPGSLDGTKQSKHSRAKHLDKRISTASLSFRKLMMDSSIGRSLQLGPISMKRSSSSSGKSWSSSFAQGESGRRDSILPL